ncbi:Hypothetical_protein [Hexamita inflata]|uniref:Hypothetical_protein n=1 Tax=Hexamita inflata TaxID=28002 RepID=A0AA86V351_9EUKA|nr:Hypothetical protein HINF_LOCUS62072 [Hexamita inflata]
MHYLVVQLKIKPLLISHLHLPVEPHTELRVLQSELVVQDSLNYFYINQTQFSPLKQKSGSQVCVQMLANTCMMKTLMLILEWWYLSLHVIEYEVEIQFLVLLYQRLLKNESCKND